MSNFNLLIVEDQPMDAELMVDALRTAGLDPTWERVETEPAYLEHLTPAPDLILSDYNLPKFDGLRALNLLKERDLDIPFILVSGNMGEELAVRAMRAGAADYLLKDRPARLGQAVLHALEQKRLRDEKKRADEELVKTQQHFRALIEKSADAIVLVDSAGTVLYASPSISRLLGGASDYWLGGNWLNRAHPDDLPTVSNLFAQILLAPCISLTAQFRYQHINGDWLWLEATGTNLLDEPSVRAIVGNIRDITARKRAEESLQESEERFRQLFAASPDAILLLDPTDQASRWPIVDCNQVACQMNGYTREELIGQSIDLLNLEPGTPSERAAYVESIRRTGVLRLEALHRHKDGHIFPVETSTSLINVGGRQLILGIDRDVSERKRAAAEIAQRADQFAALYETARDLSEQNSLQTLLETIVERATTLLGAPEGEIFLYDPAHLDLRVVVVKGSHVPLGMRMQMGEGLAGRVAQTHAPLIVDDYQQWPQRTPQLWNVAITACLTVPMLFGGELIGVLGVNETNLNRKFNETDVRLLSLFASQAASAVHNTRLLEETQQRAAQLSTLNGIGRAISTLQNIDELLELIYHEVQHSLQLDVFYVGLYDVETNQFAYRLMYDEGVPYKEQAGTLLRNTHLGQVVHDATPILLNRTIEELKARAARGRLANVDKPSASLLFVPLQIGQRIIGAMSAQSYTLNAYTQDDLTLLTGIASQAAIAIENARLFEETNQRVVELTVFTRISAKLRMAQSLDEMLPGLLDEMLTVLNAQIGSIWLYDAALDAMKLTVGRDWFPDSPMLLKRGEGIPGHVLATDNLYVATEMKSDPAVLEQMRPSIPVGANGICVPIRAGDDFSGVVFVIIEAPREFTSDEIRLLETLALMGGGTIHRMRLYEQTENQIRFLGALRAIDMAISGSVDLRTTLNILLDQVVTQLNVHASCVLLLNSHTNTLEYAAARGFKTRGVERSRLRVGLGLAGRAALERRTVTVPDLQGAALDAVWSQLVGAEKFVAYYGVPLISKGRVTGVLEIFHREPITPTAEWLNFLDALAGQAAIAIDNATLFQEIQRSNIELALAYDATIEGWSQALDLRDKETEGHSQRVTEGTVALARRMGLTDKELVQIRRGALLHDIGKMGIPDNILLKPGPLTEQEWVVMRLHPVYAFEFLGGITYLRPALDIPYCHHEKWDGSGYPRGLRGQEIPLSARIFAVVDVWDALRSDRPYRKAWEENAIREHLLNEASKQFDPAVVQAFLDMLDSN